MAAPLIVIASSVVFLLIGPQVVQLVPKAMFGALLLSSGASMLTDNLRQAWSNFPRREFVLVILHVVLTGALGMLYAVVLGLVFTAVIFIIQYSRHSGVLQVRSQSSPILTLAHLMPLCACARVHCSSPRATSLHLHALVGCSHAL